jgi:CBS domain-containing protein
MSIRDILSRKSRAVETIGARETVKAAADTMRDRNIGALVVTDARAIQGIITERKIVRALSDFGGALPSLKVGDVMSNDIVTVDAAEGVKRAMRLMMLRRVRHLLVTEEKVIAGIVSIGDVIKNRLEDLELEANVLRDAWIARH